MILALEPWFARTTGRIVFDADGWTIRSADGSRTAHLEHTVALTEDAPLVLTRREQERSARRSDSAKPAIHKGQLVLQRQSLAQELPPRCLGLARRCWRDLSPFEDPAPATAGVEGIYSHVTEPIIDHC
jgi:hypothetical protein